ncbi:hypothetical protein TNCV_403821 [Trichonephila clavipes]|nr:hypothetical protein TNCV_403821 [Trichonephila clavipes]
MVAVGVYEAYDRGKDGVINQTILDLEQGSFNSNASRNGLLIRLPNLSIREEALMDTETFALGILNEVKMGRILPPSERNGCKTAGIIRRTICLGNVLESGCNGA